MTDPHMTGPPVTDPQSTGPAVPAVPLHCPTCGSEVRGSDSFCEACGTSLAFAAATDADGTPLGSDDDLLESPITLSRSLVSSTPEAATDTVVVNRRPCRECGGTVGPDGYCEVCGTKAPTERDHYTEQPAPWVAACSDRGIRHDRNEDASAIAADAAPGSRAVLVACDGVSTSTDSDVAALAAARAARDVLVAHNPAGIGLPASRTAAVASAIGAAVAAANDAVIAHTAPNSPNAASCTFACAVVEGDQATYGNVGDSRVYWIPDTGEAALLSVDDSVAQLRIDSGATREQAEAGPQAHAITKWLGRDAPDLTPTTGTVQLTEPGWLVVCTDGLWNYASEPRALQHVFAEQIATIGSAGESAVGLDPLPLTEALVRWACDQGGKDNITVALARRS
ncbi:protein phosphatase 2C domain-containing protein [Microlunatus ginsengisoli]|uniref:Protein phosphatase 2C domain-containing protein n=1 Tax=Microlunatus ginsengisoli TaxID=363863 RepID=A0ABP6ZWH3_9ACTN